MRMCDFTPAGVAAALAILALLAAMDGGAFS
jgi:hypothetical protein